MSDDYLQDLVNNAVAASIDVNLEVLQILLNLAEQEGIEDLKNLNSFDSYVFPSDTFTDTEKAMQKFFSVLKIMEVMDLETLLPELFLQVEEATESADMDNLMGIPLMLDAYYAKNVSNAVIAQDMDLLRETIKGDQHQLICQLIKVIGLLKMHPKKEIK
jgi:hypothetical protein